MNFRPSAVMKAIQDTCLEITQDDTAGNALKRIVSESKSVVILIHQMIESGMIAKKSEVKQEYIEFVDYLMDFCTKMVLESSSVNSISDCFGLATGILQHTELNPCNLSHYCFLIDSRQHINAIFGKHECLGAACDSFLCQYISPQHRFRLQGRIQH